MIKEIYTRSPDDPNYVFGIYEHEDPIETIITKIKMILGTIQGQILGDVNFGIGLEELIFETRINKLDLEEKINDQIYQYIDEAGEYKIRPSVSFGKEDGYDYCVVDIYINKSKIFGIIIS